jgi:hypothetical protein
VQKSNEGSSGRWSYDIWVFWGKCKLKVSQVAILSAEDYNVLVFWGNKEGRSGRWAYMGLLGKCKLKESQCAVFLEDYSVLVFLV